MVKKYRGDKIVCEIKLIGGTTMEKIVWYKKYNIGNNVIDKQHQYLVKLINLMIDEKAYITNDAVKAILWNFFIMQISIFMMKREL